MNKNVYDRGFRCLDVDELRREALALARGGKLHEALKLVEQFVMYFLHRDSSTARVFSSPVVDDLCQEIGASALSGQENGKTKRKKGQAEEEWDQERAVFLVTKLYPTGGHTRVLRDLIKADGGARPIVLVTNAAHQDKLADVKQLVQVDCEVEIDEQEDWGEKLNWLQRRLVELKPDRVYILQHPYDGTIVGAVQPELVNKLIYYHNCDHLLSLGVHLRHAQHIDFNAKGYFHCRDDLGVLNTRIWPLTAAPPAATIEHKFMADGELRTCCCGGMEKFELPHLLDPVPYTISYPELIVRRLQGAPGAHVHIGTLSDMMRENIGRALAAAGLDSARFEYLPFVPLLADALRTLKIDLYLGSMPKGGGRATVEAMAAGAPLLLHSSYRSIFFTDRFEVYPEAWTWETLDDFEARLKAVTPRLLARHSKLSRAQYDGHHRPEALKASLEATLKGEPFVPPNARPSLRPNEAQAYLDEREAERTGLEITAEDARWAEEQAWGAKFWAQDEARAAERQARDAVIAELQGVLSERDSEVASLKQQLEDARHYPSKSAFALTSHMPAKQLVKIVFARLSRRRRDVVV